MNPELQRNLWLNLTARRIGFLTAVVLGVALGVYLLHDDPAELVPIAKVVVGVLLVVWGGGEAAQSVIGEIRTRTWDSQRLSAIGAWPMVWGKLLGSTVHIWYAALLLLAGAVAAASAAGSAGPTLIDVVLIAVAGLAAQAVAFFASLLLVRRRSAGSRLDVVFCQVAGAVAALILLPAGSARWGLVTVTEDGPMPVGTWWGFPVNDGPYQIALLLAALAWAVVGSTRLMRHELQLRNGPLVWCGFLAFAGLFAFGYSGVAPIGQVQFGGVDMVSLDSGGLGALLAVVTVTLLTYAAALLEPKDPVQRRWLLGQWQARRFTAVAANLPAFAYGWAAVALTLLALAPTMPAQFGLAVFAGLGFLTRDLGLILQVNRVVGRGRGDVAAAVMLAVLWLVAGPAIAAVSGGDLAYLLLPAPAEPAFLGVAAAWGQAAVVWLIGLAPRMPRSPRTQPA